MQLPNGDLTRTPGKAQDIFQQSHFPGARTKRRPERSSNKSGANSADWHMARNMVTEDRVRRAVNSFMSYKAPGLDGIYPICLQKGLDQIIKYLIKIYKGSIAMGYTKTMEGCQRGSHTETRQGTQLGEILSPHKPSSFMLKTLERIMGRFLREGTLTRHPLQESQHAY